MRLEIAKFGGIGEKPGRLADRFRRRHETLARAKSKEDDNHACRGSQQMTCRSRAERFAVTCA
jgi:hypothetical protein